ncbi:MAG: hypothetical protein JXP34_18680 [Planctomycetes bacterium]|nr:hypothetical protein [Planctomycetota bacterium]
MKTSRKLLPIGLLFFLCLSHLLGAQESVIRGREILLFRPRPLAAQLFEPALATDGSDTFTCAWVLDPITREGEAHKPDQILITRGEKTGRITRSVACLAVGPAEVGSDIFSLDLAMNPAGESVALWGEYRSIGGDPQRGAIRRNLFASLLAKTGGVSKRSFSIHESADVQKRSPAVSMAADGRFAVVWQEASNQPPINFILCQRFDPSGRPVGDKIVVESDARPGPMPLNPDIAVSKDGHIGVVWERRLPEPLPQEAKPRPEKRVSIRGILVDREGQEVARFETEPGAPEQWAPRIAMNASGCFVLAWGEGDFDAVWNPKPGMPLPGHDVRARLFDDGGKPLTEAFKVNGTPVCSRGTFRLSVAIDAQGRSVVVWETFNKAIPADNWVHRGEDLYVQRFDPSGRKIGEERRVNADPAGDDEHPAVGVFKDTIMVAWVKGCGELKIKTFDWKP